MSRTLYKYKIGFYYSHHRHEIAFATITADGHIDAAQQAERRFGSSVGGRVVSIKFEGKA